MTMLAWKRAKSFLLFSLMLFPVVFSFISGCSQFSRSELIRAKELNNELNEKIEQLNEANEGYKQRINELESANSELEQKYTDLWKEYNELLDKLSQSSPEKEVKEINGLVRVDDLDDTIQIELRYATANNFTGKKIYPASVCLLRKETAQKLVKANKEFRKMGYRIKIWDAYRPLQVQQILWDLVKDSRYVANPQRGSKHNRGTAVDITLVDSEGNELVMPTGFDDFSKKASRDYEGMTEEAEKNLNMMTEVMLDCGFTTIRTEWWHFDDKDWANYPLLDIPLDEFS